MIFLNYANGNFMQYFSIYSMSSSIITATTINNWCLLKFNHIPDTVLSA